MQASLKHWKPVLLWTMLIGLYGYWHLIPEVSFINHSSQAVQHIEIRLPADSKVYRQIAPDQYKSFRYHPRSASGSYELRVILANGVILKESARLIKPWNFGHKVVFELLPDDSIRVDLSYSLFTDS